jgi:putative N6-adenine-specific DNA methylase
MTYLYQDENRYFAQTAPGLENAAAIELTALGADPVEARFMGVSFSADKTTLYRANYECRLISRVLAPLAAFSCQSEDELYQRAMSLTWIDFLRPHQTFAVYATRSKDSGVRHTGYGALKLKDAVADYFQRKMKRRPNVNKHTPDVWINVHFEKQAATISIDTSGGSLHKRGYRRKTVAAPMQETVAAAILHFSRWDGKQPLYDPMCGSGTLLTEALMHHARIPAGFLRTRFGFENLPDYDPLLWRRTKTAADRLITPLSVGLINGSDRAKAAVDAARTNSRMLPFGNRIALSCKRFQQLGGLPGYLIVCNPPYGIRLEDREGAAGLYRAFGDFLKQKCRGATAYVYFGEHHMVPHLGLKPAWKKPIKNGGLDGRLVKYDVY